MKPLRLLPHICLFLVASIICLLALPLHADKHVPIWNYTVLETAPHNPKSFTQGLIKEGDTFYESSGLYRRSFVQRYKPLASSRINLPGRYFAEGLTLFNDELYLLTWKEETLFVLDKQRLQVLRTLPYAGEGWGLTHNGEHLIMSNGSSLLTFRDAKDFSIVREVTVTGLTAINELEYIHGVLWANSLNNDHLFAINPDNGCVIGKVDLQALRRQTVKPEPGNVLNGIAYDQAANALWVTGKRWPKRYLIRLTHTAIDQVAANDHTC